MLSISQIFTNKESTYTATLLYIQEEIISLFCPPPHVITCPSLVLGATHSGHHRDTDPWKRNCQKSAEDDL